jgi:uncharacterized tellurite resistance protein B-like protein
VSISDFFNQYLRNDTETSSAREHTLELCAAVLMLEIALADSGMDEDEYAVIEQAISHHFHLNSEETTSLLGLARNEVDHATSLHDFTRIVNNSLAAKEKTIIIELLWRVAVADQVIDKYEEYFIRKISDLLYVSHADYIKAKHRATL